MQGVKKTKSTVGNLISLAKTKRQHFKRNFERLQDNTLFCYEKYF
jgi:hypothetical protein